MYPFVAVGKATADIVDGGCCLVSEVGTTCLVVDMTTEAGDDLVAECLVLDGWGGGAGDSDSRGCVGGGSDDRDDVGGGGGGDAGGHDGRGGAGCCLRGGILRLSSTSIQGKTKYQTQE